MTKCIACGCSEFFPCVDAANVACSWAVPGLCTACAEEELRLETPGDPDQSGSDEPLVQLVSDAQASAFLRARTAAREMFAEFKPLNADGVRMGPV